jgi:hypothetical protein
MLKILFIIMGIVLTSIGLSNIILYLNLLVWVIIFLII